jgi:hypothetical protein
MKRFVKKIKAIILYENEYINASLFMRIITWFSVLMYAIVWVIMVVVLSITLPVWIIPYVVWWCKKEGAE